MNIVRSLSIAALPCFLIACGGTPEGSENAGNADMPETEVTAAGAETAPDQNMDPAREKATAPEPAAPAGPTTSITFAENAHDFGTIDEGDAVTHIFTFTNTGDNPLILSKCKGSCGCTVPQCPKDPIAPGATGEIEVKFNSKGKKNKQTKTVTITANTVPETTRLTISADVTPAPAEDAGK